MSNARAESRPRGEEGFRRLLKLLYSLPEAGMRTSVLLERWRGTAPAEIFAFLCWLARRSRRRDPPARVGLAAVGDAIIRAQGDGQLYELLAEVYRQAREQDEQTVVNLLLISVPARGPLTEEEAGGDRQLARLTLGERKFLARGRDRYRLDRLLTDADPAVIHNLLLNPRLTERDVVRMAARRPARDVILREIAASRFINRYRVKLALVSNPYTPTEIALKLVPFLLRPDLKRISTDNTLHQLVREQAARLLAEARRPADKERD